MSALVARFRAAVAPEAAPKLPSDEELEVALKALSERSFAARPELSSAGADWVEALASTVTLSTDVRRMLSTVIVEDLVLARACVQGNSEALAEVDGLLPAVRGAIERVERSGDFVQEVLQLLRTRLWVTGPGERPKIASYSGQGSLSSWLRAVALRIALRLRRERAEEPVEQEALVGSGPVSQDPEFAFLRQKYREDFRQSFGEALLLLEARDIAVLKLYLLDGLALDEIGDVFGVHPASVSRWVAAVREKLLAGTREALAKRLGLSRSELDSMMRLLNEDLNISLVPFLKMRG